VGARHGVPWLTSYLGEKIMRTASLTVLALVAAFLFSVLPAQAAMDHGSGAAHYSDRAFLSGMIAHHEGAVDMAKVFLATPKKEQDPQVTAWADDVIKVQEKEIAEMKELLKPLGGIEESAYAPMKKAMQHMLEEGKNLGANMRFVELMLPHHAMALEMSVPALLGSNNPQILNLAENIIISQGNAPIQGVDSRTSQEVVSYTNIYFENESFPFPSNKKIDTKTSQHNPF